MSGSYAGFEVREALGSDAVGSWHRAVRNEQCLTLRILREEFRSRADARQILLEELRRTATIRHAGLLEVFAKDITADRPWMLTDSIEGPTLEQFLAQRGPQPEATAVTFARRITGALAYLEERAQVHIDVRPARILRVGTAWRLWTFRDIRAADELGSKKGTSAAAPLWAAPERVREHPAPWHAPAQVAWSVGCVLRAVLGQGPPLDEGGTWQDPTTGVSEAMGLTLGRLLALDPALRPQGAAAVDRLLVDPSATESTPAPPPLAPAPVPRRRRGDKAH